MVMMMIMMMRKVMKMMMMIMMMIRINLFQTISSCLCLALPLAPSEVDEVQLSLNTIVMIMRIVRS